MSASMRGRGRGAKPKLSKATPLQKPVQKRNVLNKTLEDSGGGGGSTDSLRILANRYEVHKKLGKGNFGTAFLVRDMRAVHGGVDEWKVSKDMPIGDIAPDETVDAMSEARLLSKLSHPFIVKFYDSFLATDTFIIICEYCDGGDLKLRIAEAAKNKTHFEQDVVMRWFVQLMMAVEYMHSRKVLHRDLTTGNIFLKNNNVKIGDLGISKVLLGTCDMASTFTGTPYYMSPEVLKHTGYNSKSDVWSCGCILYELCTLNHAFEGQGLMGVMYKIVEGAVPDITMPDIYNPAINTLFKDILVREADSRPSASDILQMPFLVSYMHLIKEESAAFVERQTAKLTADKEAEEIYKLLREPTHLEHLKATTKTSNAETDQDAIRRAEEEIIKSIQREKTKFVAKYETSEELAQRQTTPTKKSAEQKPASPKEVSNDVTIKAPTSRSLDSATDAAAVEDDGDELAATATSIDELRQKAMSGERLTPRQQMLLRKAADAEKKSQTLRDFTKQTYAVNSTHKTINKNLAEGTLKASPVQHLRKSIDNRAGNSFRISSDYEMRQMPASEEDADLYYSQYDDFDDEDDELQYTVISKAAPHSSNDSGYESVQQVHFGNQTVHPKFLSTSSRYLTPTDNHGASAGSTLPTNKKTLKKNVQFQNDSASFDDDEAYEMAQDYIAEEAQLAQYMNDYLAQQAAHTITRTKTVLPETNNSYSAYGPWAKQQKLANMEKRCLQLLGDERYNAAMNYLNSMRGQGVYSDSAVSQGLSTIVGGDREVQFMLEQLQFLQRSQSSNSDVPDLP